ncbi:MAG: aminoglycoside phosphotransferase family protein, partial [Oscillospiraceae bacterium]
MSNNIDYEKEINKYFEKIVKAFAGQCDYTLPIVYGHGHINDTYYTQIKYNENQGTKLILQRINHNIFTNPPKLMENIYGVTEFLKKRIALHGGDVMRETLTVIKTKDLKNYYQDDEGYYWRAYIFIDNATTYQEVKTIDDFQACGRAFGEFQKQLAQYPANLLFESIKDFHNTKKRFNDLLQAIEENKADRKHLVEKEITFALKRKDDACEIVNMLENNIIPLRVTHNDTKLNNIMIDDNTSKAICVIDLDTIMPGAACYDFGDSIRFGASSGAEDE